MTWPIQAFRIGLAIIDSVSEEEIKATFSSLKELDLARPPFDEFDIIVPEKKVISSKNEKGEKIWLSGDYEARLRYTKNGRFLMMQDGLNRSKFTDFTTLKALQGIPAEEMDKYISQAGEVLDNYLQLLVVLLATKNVIKETKECKTLKLGIGSKERNRYTTTLKIGLITEQTKEKGEATGLILRPHLRRGHIRRQHYGPGYEYIKKIWIEPVFVNADPDWIGERTAYNVSLSKPLSKP